MFLGKIINNHQLFFLSIAKNLSVNKNKIKIKILIILLDFFILYKAKKEYFTEIL